MTNLAKVKGFVNGLAGLESRMTKARQGRDRVLGQTPAGTEHAPQTLGSLAATNLL